ncbi:MAG TPA: hypothetical protein VJ866_20835 [Pyrinomonadaceae bacterium]|nr:hypothetical protein [Pyrinomonadaceae bacterium]
MSNISEHEKAPPLEEESEINPSPAAIWEVIDEVISGVPDEVLNRLPADGAERHDHYLRDTHRQPRRES